MMVAERQEAADGMSDEAERAYEQMRQLLDDIDDAIQRVRSLARRIRQTDGG